MNPQIHKSSYLEIFQNSKTMIGSTAESRPIFSQTSSVWTINITEINSTTDKPIFMDDTIIPSKGLPSNHPAWKELESLLLEIDEIPNYTDGLDENWVDNLRSGWSNRSSDLYESTDWD